LGERYNANQRSKIQQESLYYEHKKHEGSLPIVGVNTIAALMGAGKVCSPGSMSHAIYDVGGE
jgi:methylmalonyl-CoA mutase